MSNALKIAAGMIGGGVGGDEFFAYVSLLMHMDGSDNGTTFTDETGKTVSAFGNAVTKTATKQFGTASAYFDGTGDYLTIPSSADFAFGTGDFTIECWAYFTSLAGNPTLWSRGSSPGSGTCLWTAVGPDGSVNPLYSTSFDSWNAGAVSAAGAISINTWYHIASLRESGVAKLYIDGTLAGTDSTPAAAASIQGSTGPFVVGSYRTLGDLPMAGYIDDFRITKGVARYTGNFTPTGPFPDA